MALFRLDKLLSQSGERTRSEAVKMIRAGFVSVDGISTLNPAHKADTVQSVVILNGKRISDIVFQYVMIHKPAGIITAARDLNANTVMSLVPNAMQARDVMPVGRLDKNTTGLLLLTNDGTLAHRLLSPRMHVWKEYLATVDGPLLESHIHAFATGIMMHEFTAKPAELRIVRTTADESEAVVRLREGKYHQVKRMFAVQGLQVKALHRQAFGPLRLDVSIGEYRALRKNEIEELYAAVQMDWEGHHG